MLEKAERTGPLRQSIYVYKDSRFHRTMNRSTQEDTRQLAAVLQHKVAKVDIALDLRS